MEAGNDRGSYRLGEWTFRPASASLTRGDETRNLGSRELRVLRCLVAQHGEVVAREALRAACGPGESVSDHELAGIIAQLRLTLGDSAADPRYIVDVADRGYALVSRFEPLGSGRDAAAPAAEAGSPRTASWGRRVASLASEMRRRQVFKVLGGYLVGMWLVLQVAQTTFAPLHFPGWWMTALTILAVTGIPIVGMLAWSYEITPEGVVRDPADLGHVLLPRPRRAVAPWLVAGVALMAGVTALAWWRSIREQAIAEETAPAPQPAAHSIAVLPLVDMSPGGGSAYLGDGLSEELSAQLAQVPGLRVASRTSAFEFRGKSEDVRRIGEALGVSHVLEGSVRRDGDKLRVTMQLIDAANGYHVWAGTYDRAWSDVIALQDEIARAITSALQVVLTPEEATRLDRGKVANLDAYDLYLEGVAALRRSGDLGQIDAARDQFRKAIEADPQLARAHAGLCESGVRRYSRTQAPADVAEAESACRRALELEPTREATELALGRLYLISGRAEQAEAVYRGLLARRPADADVYIGLGNALLGEGQKEAAEQAYRRAVESEPSYWAAHSALGNFYFSAGRADRAIVEFRRTTDLVPQSAAAYSNLGGALMLDVRLKEAAAAFERSISIAPSSGAQANLGTLYYFLGDFPRAVQHYKQAEVLGSEDQSVVGMYADSLWQIDGRRAEAVEQYRRAIGLADAALKVNPADAVTWAQLAYYCGRVGDGARATRAQARAEALGVEDMYVDYYVALTEADRGSSEAARAAVERALRHGYTRKLLEVDPALKQYLPAEASRADRQNKT